MQEREAQLFPTFIISNCGIASLGCLEQNEECSVCYLEILFLILCAIFFANSFPLKTIFFIIQFIILYKTQIEWKCFLQSLEKKNGRKTRLNFNLLKVKIKLFYMLDQQNLEEEQFQDSLLTINHERSNYSKFNFISKMYNNTKMRPRIQKFIQMQSQGSEKSTLQSPISAKDVLKSKILIQKPQQLIYHSKETPILMKGKMLIAIKKPIQNQMTSFLLGINQRINREVERSHKMMELPIINRSEQASNIPNRKSNYLELFKNLKQLRNKKDLIPDQSNLKYQRVLESRKFNKISQEIKLKPQTISYESKIINTNLDDKQFPIMRNNASELTKIQKQKQKQVSLFRKGYMSYDKQGKQFLQKFLQNSKQLLNKKIESQNQITAKSYLVINCLNLKLLAGKNINQQIQIASLSKIMTCYLCLLVCVKYQIDIYTHQTRVSQKAVEMLGTSAQLQKGDILTIYDLLMGLMLPSGNDASVAIAEAMGKIIQRHKKKETKKNYFQTFIAHMNLLSRELKLNQIWGNSSGLPVNPNFSSPLSIGILSSLAIKNPIFNKIVSTKIHEIEIKNERYGLIRRITWRNTNKLLEEGWDGVKTGTTDTAGHCLAAKRNNLLFCVFNCDSLSKRFSECVKLYQKSKNYQND